MARRIHGTLTWAMCGALFATLGLASRTDAVVIAYESFSYDPGPLAGLNGGTGWLAEWVDDTGGIADVVTGGLDYTDSMGNALVASGNSAFSSGMSGAAGQVGRMLDPQGDDPEGDGGTTTWWSFVGRRLAPHPTQDENVIRASSLQIHNALFAPTERLAVGKGTTGPGGPVPDVHTEWSMLHSAAAGNSVFTTDPILEQAFLVVRIDHVGLFGDSLSPDSAWLWVDPRLDVQPDVMAADASFPADVAFQDFTFDRVRTFVGGTNAVGPWAEFAFDEIRLGTTYADVAPFTAPPADDADFDDDNDVDGNDFLIWQKGLGVGSTNMQGDADGNGMVNAADLAIWRAAYPTAIAAAETIPEPGSWVLSAAAMLGPAAVRRR